MNRTVTWIRGVTFPRLASRVVAGWAAVCVGGLVGLLGVAAPSIQASDDGSWARLTEDENGIKIETDQLEALIPKRNPKQWMTGISKGSFLDKATGFREAGDGLMVIDWLMEAGSDVEYSDSVIAPGVHDMVC